MKEAFRDVDLILHAGDIYQPRILDELETLAPVLAALGNGDREVTQDSRLAESHVLNVARIRIGLTHAINYPSSPQYPFDRTIAGRFDEPVDIVVFGDTHVATVVRDNGILLVNPGSPTLPNSLFELGTVGLLEIIGKIVKAHIVPLSMFPLPFDRELTYYRGASA